MAVQKPVAEAWMKATGRPIIEGYGLSETSPVLTCNRGDITEWTGTIGLPMPSTEISIRDDDGKEVPLGEQGEICARGPQVMAGYWQRPDETAKVMTRGRLLPHRRHRRDGRRRPRPHRRPQEGHDQRLRLQGVPERGRGRGDEPWRPAGMRGGRRARPAFRRGAEAVRGEETPELTEAELRAFLRAKLASYKVPKQIEFRDELPKTNVGKILRRALRDEAIGPPTA